MLTISGRGRPFPCDGVSRRAFLRIGAIGGLSLPDLLSARAASPAAAKPTKSVIVFWLKGGPPHLDTYDLKPEAPAEFRGALKPTATKVPGFEICEFLEQQAEITDKLALLRAVVGMEDFHRDDILMSGWNPQRKLAVGQPSLGAVVSKLQGFRRPDVPPFVSLYPLTPGLEPGNLGIAHRAFCPTDRTADDLRLPSGVDLKRLEDRKALLEGFDTMRRDLDTSGKLEGMDAFRQRAFAMVTSDTVRKALDVTQEPKTVRERYESAKELLIARRLVQAGVGCVTVAPSIDWDSHQNHFSIIRDKQHLPLLDASVTALVEDLHRLGLEKDVLLVVWGEFGRTPRINSQGGRDHWPNVMSCLLAGGGLKMGQVIGSTTPKGEEAKEGRYHVQNVLATIYHTLGIDPGTTFPDHTGRPQYLLDDRDLIKELL
jgi:uncharacterized protein (DUF1501 family)